MRRKQTEPYSHYGSTKGVWKTAVGMVLAALGGIGTAIALSLAAGRWLPSLGELALYLAVLTLGVIGIAACGRTDHLCWGLFLTVLCVFVTRSLAVMVRADILAQATLISGGSRVPLAILCVILTVGIGIGLFFAFGREHWVYFVVISVIVVFPTLKNCMDAVNVAADKKPTRTAVAEVTQTSAEKEDVILAKAGSVDMDVYYITVGENDTVPAGTELKVGKALFASLRPGDRVRVLLHPGALGMPWIEVVPGE